MCFSQDSTQVSYIRCTCSELAFRQLRDITTSILESTYGDGVEQDTSFSSYLYVLVYCPLIPMVISFDYKISNRLRCQLFPRGNIVQYVVVFTTCLDLAVASFVEADPNIQGARWCSPSHIGDWLISELRPLARMFPANKPWPMTGTHVAG